MGPLLESEPTETSETARHRYTVLVIQVIVGAGLLWFFGDAFVWKSAPPGTTAGQHVPFPRLLLLIPVVETAVLVVAVWRKASEASAWPKVGAVIWAEFWINVVLVLGLIGFP